MGQIFRTRNDQKLLERLCRFELEILRNLDVTKISQIFCAKFLKRKNLAISLLQPLFLMDNVMIVNSWQNRPSYHGSIRKVSRTCWTSSLLPAGTMANHLQWKPLSSSGSSSVFLKHKGSTACFSFFMFDVLFHISSSWV